MMRQRDPRTLRNSRNVTLPPADSTTTGCILPYHRWWLCRVGQLLTGSRRGGGGHMWALRVSHSAVVNAWRERERALVRRGHRVARWPLDVGERVVAASISSRRPARTSSQSAPSDRIPPSSSTTRDRSGARYASPSTSSTSTRSPSRSPRRRCSCCADWLGSAPRTCSTRLRTSASDTPCLSVGSSAPR